MGINYYRDEFVILNGVGRGLHKCKKIEVHGYDRFRAVVVKP